jgi:hypothetical protein
VIWIVFTTVWCRVCQKVEEAWSESKLKRRDNAFKKRGKCFAESCRKIERYRSLYEDLERIRKCSVEVGWHEGASSQVDFWMGL